MIESNKRMSSVTGSWRYGAITLVVLLVLSVAAAAQDRPTGALAPVPQQPAVAGVPLKALFTPASPGLTGNSAQAAESHAVTQREAYSPPATSGSAGVRRITLDEAQQMAAGESNPLVRLGELQVKAAKEHRLGVQALYFPSIGSQFENFHLNKATGDVLTGPLGRPFSSKLFAKDSTGVNVGATQPITPLFAIYQLVKIARADENIARAKAGMPVKEVAGKVEQSYFDLLVAERELTSAQADAKKIQSKWLTASTGTPNISAEQEKDMINAEKAVLVPASKVKELTASLDAMLGLPEGTTLELAPPEPLVENLTLTEVTEKAMAANAEVVEAEQTAIKAKAASTISKMAYAPTVAVTGGYANQNLIDLVFPRAFSYIGVVATYTVFDFGKREHDVGEAKANSEAAALGVQLVKAKVAASVKSTYFDLERSRQFTQLARRMMSATQVVEASYKSDNPEVESARAKVEADMFRAELEYRQAYSRLKSLIGDK